MLGVVTMSLMLLAPAPQGQPASPSPGAARSRERSKALEEALEEAEKASRYLDKRAKKARKMERKEIEEFLEEAEEYLEDHREAAEALPPLPDRAEPAQVSAHSDSLAARIRDRRRDAKRGDIFTDRMALVFARILERELARSGPDRRVVLTEGNPSGDEEKFGTVKVAVNARYAPSAPLSTVPPTLLLQLPPLPKELEYRFVGRTLLLRDAVANLIVDYIENAVP